MADISAMVVNAVGGGSEEDIAEAGKVCGAFSGKTHMRATIVRADGRVLFDSDYDSSGMSNHLKRKEIASALSGTAARDIRYSQTMKTRMLYLASPAGKVNPDGTYRSACAFQCRSKTSRGPSGCSRSKYSRWRGRPSRFR